MKMTSRELVSGISHPSSCKGEPGDRRWDVRFVDKDITRNIPECQVQRGPCDMLQCGIRRRRIGIVDAGPGGVNSLVQDDEAMSGYWNAGMQYYSLWI